MTKLRNVLALTLLVPGLAFSADSALLGLLMPDAKAVAGIQVNQARVSPFGQYVLAHMQPDDASFKKFMTDTGFDPRRDVSEIVMASNWDSNVTAHWLIVARGMFDSAKIEASLLQNGGTRTSFSGVDILSGNTASAKDGDSVIAFCDNSTAVMGDPDSVKSTIQRFQSKADGSHLADQVKSISGTYDFWFRTLVPVSEFAGLMPDPNIGQAMNGNLFQAISQASGGVKFGANVQFAVQAVTRSEKDAQALVDVVRFIGGLIQTNRDKSPVAGQVSTLVDSMNLSAAGNVMTMSLMIPETQVESMLDQARIQKHTAKKEQHRPSPVE